MPELRADTATVGKCGGGERWPVASRANVNRATDPEAENLYLRVELHEQIDVVDEEYWRELRERYQRPREPSVGLGGGGGGGGGGPGLGGGNGNRECERTGLGGGITCTVEGGGAGLGGGGLERKSIGVGHELSLQAPVVQPNRGELEGDDSPRASIGAAPSVLNTEAARGRSAEGLAGGDPPQDHGRPAAARTLEEPSPTPTATTSIERIGVYGATESGNATNAGQPSSVSEGAGAASDATQRSTDPHAETDGMSIDAIENRPLLVVHIGGKPYSALFDTGAQVTVMGRRVTREFRSRIEATPSMVHGFSGSAVDIIGRLRLTIEIDTVVKTVNTYACEQSLQYDIYLGWDFIRAFGITFDAGTDGWRVAGRGDWHVFAEKQENRVFFPVQPGYRRAKLAGEIAGLSVFHQTDRERVEELIKRVVPKESPARTDLIEHVIDVQGARPVKTPMRRYSPPMLDFIRSEIKDWYEKGLIRPSQSEWCSAPVVVNKPDGIGKRLCIDLRPVNKVTRIDAYPTPGVDSVLDRLRNARFISKIDLKSAYLQVPLSEESKQYTAFGVPTCGLWECNCMIFGLVNAPATFMRLMDALFGPEFEPFVFKYLDDVIVVTETLEEHLEWLEKALKRMVEAGLQINVDKSEFLCSSVTFLGYRLDSEGLRPDPDRVEPVLNFPRPRNVKQLRRFLGMVGWYSRFIEHESEIKIPLTKLMHKDVRWHWGTDQQRAFDLLKRALTEAPVLVRPDFDKTFYVHCDASSYALGACLMQKDEDGYDHPICYASRMLNSHERNYTVSELECLGLLFAIKKFRPYIEGTHFVAITDHTALTWLRNKKEPTGRLARWVLELQQWDFDLVYRRGQDHHVPDALSRGFEGGEDVAAFEVITDEWYLQRLRDVEERPAKYKNWKVEDGMLYRYCRNDLLDPVTHREECWRLVVPLEYRERVMSDAHCEPSSGHFGREKTYDRVAREYSWHGMWYDVQEFVRSCPQCQKYKVEQFPQKGTMSKRLVERPWAVIATDVIELPRSKNRFKYLVVFQDLFTKWVEFKPLTSATGKTLAQALEELVLFRWEVPDYLVSDNGKNYVGSDFKETLKAYGIEHVLTPPYHQQADFCERAIKTLKTLISIFVDHDHRDWDKHLHELRHAMNTATQESTKVSPAFLNFGREPQPAKSLRREVEKRGPVVRISPEEWKDRMKRLSALRDLVIRHVEKAQAKQKKHFDSRHTATKFQIDDLVLRRSHAVSNKAAGKTAKLYAPYIGPYRVLDIIPPDIYVLTTDNRKQVDRVSVKDLKKYYPRRAVQARK